MRNIIRREGKLLKDQSLDILMKEKKGEKNVFSQSVEPLNFYIITL